MNSDDLAKSIHNPSRKPREPVLLPKISKADPNSPATLKPFARVVTRKYHATNIFQQEHSEKPKQTEDERRDQRECEELQAKIAELTRKHSDEMQEIEERERRAHEQLKRERKKQYEVKYAIWETKNQIMSLNAQCLQQESEYQRLTALLQEQSPLEEQLQGYFEIQGENQSGEDVYSQEQTGILNEIGNHDQSQAIDQPTLNSKHE